MAEEAQYPSGTDTPSTKRKYEEQTTASPVQPQSAPRRVTGFSAPIVSTSPDSGQAPPSYNSVPPPADEIQLAKQRAQEIAARLFSNASSIEAKRPRVENGGGGFDLNDKGFSSAPSDVGQKPMISSNTSQIPVSYGYHQGSNKKIEIPNGRVGVIIGKAGETIKYLQLQSGAKIQVTRDADSDPNSQTRLVELMGTPEAIAKAEQLISDVLSEAETGGSGIVSRRVIGGSGSEQFVMKIPNNKVGLVIGKGGETIKNMQARTGARIQVIPLHLPPGDPSTERTLQIDGTSEQIESAKELVNEVISENRVRNSGMGGGYPSQGYQARPPANWASTGPPMQQPGYGGYAQPGAYSAPSPQYNMSQPPAYGGYPQPTSGGYPTWDQTTAPPSQQTTQGSGYDYYSQQPGTQQQQSQGGPAPADNTGYNYNQPPTSGYNQQGQAYSQDGYSSGYHAPAPQSGYGQPQPQPQGYDQQGYSAPAYGNPTQEGHTPSYGAQGDTTQAPPPVQPSAMGQQGYNTGPQPSSNPAGYPSQGSAQPGYAIPPASQTGYGTQPTVQSGYGPGYGPPQAQKPPAGQPVYGQTQQSPSAQGGYAQPSPVQQGYPHSQPPPSQTGYAQPDSGPQRAPSSLGTAAAQPGYGPPPYGAQAMTQSGYGQQPPPYNSSYGSGYSQPAAYAADGAASGTAQSGVAKASPPS